jgi:inositol-phosphate phosphatase/L-galactose 1-phosphate phosphatase/histidinol-phosphatase
MLAHYIDFANRLADTAAEMVDAVASTALETSAKPDKTFVTALDLDIEERLRARIAAAYPGHGIVGEEFDAEHADAEWVWTLDPIDGTMALVAGIPVYSTLIALAHRGVPVIGVMHFPAIRTRWVGARGRPTLCNGELCQTRAGAGLHDAIQSASSPDFFAAPGDRQVLDALTARTAWRIYGAAALSYGRLAMGRTDIAIDAGLKVHDYAPFVPIVEGAGGTITDWSGRPLTLDSGPRVLAAGDARRHAAALAVIAQHAFAD